MISSIDIIDIYISVDGYILETLCTSDPLLNSNEGVFLRKMPSESDHVRIEWFSVSVSSSSSQEFSDLCVVRKVGRCLEGKVD